MPAGIGYIEGDIETYIDQDKVEREYDIGKARNKMLTDMDKKE